MYAVLMSSYHARCISNLGHEEEITFRPTMVVSSPGWAHIRARKRRSYKNRPGRSEQASSLCSLFEKQAHRILSTDQHEVPGKWNNSFI